MAINIYLNKTVSLGYRSAELDSATEIKEYFMSIYGANNNVAGDIYIFPNQPLSFQRRNDIDLIIIGMTEGITISGPFKAKTNKNELKELDHVVLKSFISTIELKSHDHSGIRKIGNTYEVKYGSDWHDASKQSSEAKFSLVNFIDIQKWLRKKPFISDVLWFTSISDEDLKELRKDWVDNAMAGKFNIYKFIEAILSQVKVKESLGGYTIDFFYENGCHDMIDFFTKPRILGGLTLRKFNLISAALLRDKTKHTSDSLTIAEGKAGTGKTLWLLQRAIEESSQLDSTCRCLMLTYNNSLVYDLKRIIDGFGENSRYLTIMSVHSYLRCVMKEVGIKVTDLNDSGKKFDRVFRDKSNELRHRSNSGLRKFDKVFIDESQDLSSAEKEIFLKIFGCERIIAADGIDQFVRNTKPAKWRNVSDDKIELIEFQVSKRQKYNLVSFVNVVSGEYGLNWNGKADHLLSGGKVKIYNVYNSTIHNELLKEAIHNGCEEYDMMILVPPQMIIRDANTHRQVFSKAESFRKCGIHIFDGTDPDSRAALPSIDACRVFPYQSCRGLEGWSVVCYMLDSMYDILFAKAKVSDSYQGLDPRIDRTRQAIQWLLMPLTRPIDTLVITLQDQDSELGRTLKRLSASYPDFIEWNCKDIKD